MDQQQTGGHALFFRSDTRNPAQIFANGFQPAGGPFSRIQYRQRSAAYGVFDVEPASAICITRDFDAAAIFPNKFPTYRSWVYVLDLPLLNVVNVQNDQYREGMAAFNATPPLHQRPEFSLMAMHGQERAVQRVAPSQIVCCVEIDRRQNSRGVTEYKVLVARANPGYGGSQQFAEDVRAGAMAMAGQWRTTPTPRDGFVRNART